VNFLLRRALAPGLALALAVPGAATLSVASTAGATAAATAARIAPARARAVNGKKKLKLKKASVASGHRRSGKRKVFLERKVSWMRNGLPNVQAAGALVIDLDTGRELYSRGPDQVRPIASVSKLAAMLVVMDRNPELEGLTTITKVDAEVARGGAKSRLLEGMTLSNRDLVHAALMASDNRAVPALGRAVGLTPAQLAAAMTQKARDLGLTHTRFREPTGLSPDNVSTAREVLTLLGAVMKHPILGPITRKMEYDAHPVGRPPVPYVNTHKLARRSNVDVLGGKTGYNNVARYCLVLAAQVDGRNYGMSFLGNEGKLTRFGDVARVSDWIVARKPKGVPGAAGGGPAGVGQPETAPAVASTETAATPTATAAPVPQAPAEP